MHISNLFQKDCTNFALANEFPISHNSFYLKCYFSNLQICLKIEGKHSVGFPHCSVVKNPPAVQEMQTRGAGSIPGLGTPPPPEKGNGKLVPQFWCDCSSMQMAARRKAGHLRVCPAGPQSGLKKRRLVLFERMPTSGVHSRVCVTGLGFRMSRMWEVGTKGPVGPVPSATGCWWRIHKFPRGKLSMREGPSQSGARGIPSL